MVIRKAEFKSPICNNFVVMVTKVYCGPKFNSYHVEVLVEAPKKRYLVQKTTFSEKEATRLWLEECSALNEQFLEMDVDQILRGSLAQMVE